MSDMTVIENALMRGDLSQLSPEDRMRYYKAVCDSLGLNALTRPFDYIQLNGRLTLYAKKDATDQLRKRNGVSIAKPEIRFEDDWIIVTVEARDAVGRTDSDVGVVSKKDMRGDFGNALMKAVTKAKRRVTLSICGLGMLDETEVETIPDAVIVPAIEPPIDIPVIVVGEQEPMSLDTAENIVNSEGVRYGDIDAETLAHMATQLTKTLKSANGKLSEEQIFERQRKLAAIKVILAARNSG